MLLAAPGHCALSPPETDQVEKSRWIYKLDFWAWRRTATRRRWK
jgi:hypothetical protein